MNNLDNFSLALIFENLSLKDLINCSRVCMKWKYLIKFDEKYLFICVNTKFLPKKKKCIHYVLEPDQDDYLIPKHLTFGSFMNLNFSSKHIETFIFYGNGRYDSEMIFKFKEFPKLKYVKIIDFSFNDYIYRNFMDFLHDADEDLNIESNIEWDFYSSTIETLIMKSIDFSALILGFPNLKYIKTDELLDMYDLNDFSYEFKETKWESFICESEKNNKFDFILSFLMDYCPLLNTIGIDIKSVIYFQELLNFSTVNNFCLTLCSNRSVTDFNFVIYKDVVSKFEKRLKADCKMCINKFPIKCLDDLEKLRKNFYFNEVIKQKNFEFNQQTKQLKISGYYGIEFYKKIYDNIDNKNIIKNFHHIEELVLDLNTNENLKFYFEKLIKLLPKKIKSLTIKSKNFVSQDTLDLIPQMFSGLVELSIDSPSSKIDNFKFISSLKNLNSLNLIKTGFTDNELLKVFEYSNLIQKIHLDSNQNQLRKFKTSLMNIFMDKKLSDSFLIRINNEYINAYVLSKNNEKDCSRKSKKIRSS